jgi:hypothetical protein
VILHLQERDVTRAIRSWRQAHEFVTRRDCRLEARLSFEQLVAATLQDLSDCRTMSDLLQRYYFVDAKWIADMVDRCESHSELTPSQYAWIQGAAFWIRMQELMVKS